MGASGTVRIAVGGADGFDRFYTGRAQDGRQVLLGWDDNGLVAIWFDAGGGVIGDERLEAPERADHASHVSDQARVIRALPEWLRERGVAPGPITVREFSLEEPVRVYFQGFADWADWVLNDPTQPITREKRERCRAQFTAERAAGRFYLVWNGELYTGGPEESLHLVHG